MMLAGVQSQLSACQLELHRCQEALKASQAAASEDMQHLAAEASRLKSELVAAQQMQREEEVRVVQLVQQLVEQQKTVGRLQVSSCTPGP